MSAHSNRSGRAVVEVLLLGLCLYFGFYTGLYFWDHIALPFSNPHGVFSPLTKDSFHPANNWLRFLQMALWPLVYLRLLKSLFPFAFSPRFQDPPHLLKKSRWVPLLFSWSFWGVLVLIGLRFHARAFEISPLDFFHEGELLTPAWNTNTLGGLWTSSFFVHGAFYDSLSTLLAWKIWGPTIGASRAFAEIWTLFAEVFAIYWIAITSRALLGRSRAGSLALFFLGAFVFLRTHFQTGLLLINRRDLPFFLVFAFLLRGVRSKNLAWLFYAGLGSALCFFTAIDRGAYFTALLLAAAALECLETGRLLPKRWLFGVLPGFLLGWGIFYKTAGPVEFRSFAETTRWLFQFKDAYDSFIYDKPLWTLSRLNSIPLLALMLQCLLVCLLIFKNSNPRWTPWRKKEYTLPVFAPEIQILCLIALASVFFYRSAVGRSDDYHIQYVSFFPLIGLTLTAGYWAHESLRLRWTLALVAATLLGFQGHRVWQQTPPPASTQTLTQRLTRLVTAPDSAYLSKEQHQQIEWLRAQTQHDPCIANLTCEAALPYLLKKPSCGRDFVAWFVATRERRAEWIQYFETHRPARFVFSSPLMRRCEIDQIDNRKRLPEVEAWVQAHYPGTQEKMGWVLAQPH